MACKNSKQTVEKSSFAKGATDLSPSSPINALSVLDSFVRMSFSTSDHPVRAYWHRHNHFFTFLDESTHSYKKVCAFVGPSVCIVFF